MEFYMVVHVHLVTQLTLHYKQQKPNLDHKTTESYLNNKRKTVNVTASKPGFFLVNSILIHLSTLN